ncbi:MAG: hypothetical protein ACSHX4_10915 [Opitutaceae bacterium]
MEPDNKNQIRLSHEQTQIEVTTEIKQEVVAHLKLYFSKWDRAGKCWRLPITRLSGRAVHLLVIDHNFFLYPEAATAIRTHFKETPSTCREKDGKFIVLQGEEDRKIHAFLRTRRRAQFLPVKDQWCIRPDYELAKYLLNNLPAKLIENCRSFLESFTATTDQLERNSLDGKILHEPGTKVIPEGLTVAIGSSLHHIAKAAIIDYRLAIAFEGRPLPHTIGIAIRCKDLAKFRTCAIKRSIQFTHHTSTDI